MTTVGELKAFLNKYRERTELRVNLGPNKAVKGLELCYDILTDGISITPVYEKNSFIIEARKLDTEA